MLGQGRIETGEMADDMELMQRAGLFIRNARRLKLHNVEVTGQLGPALMLNDSADVDLSASTTHTPCPDAPVIRMSNVDGAFVHGCQASAETGVFLQLQGENTKGIVFSGNHLAQAGQAIQITGDVPTAAIIIN